MVSSYGLYGLNRERDSTTFLLEKTRTVNTVSTVSLRSIRSSGQCDSHCEYSAEEIFFQNRQKTTNFNVARIWIVFGTGTPILATTWNISMKLGHNVAWMR